VGKVDKKSLLRERKRKVCSPKRGVSSPKCGERSIGSA